MSTPSNVWDHRRSNDYTSRPGDLRPYEEKDRSRIIHSATFRRLQGKTQVLGITESDYHRTRLTHSMEVAQIGRGIVLQLHKENAVSENAKSALPNTAQIETICFGHDLGHPPFGHDGETALNFVMRGDGGFEGNGHSLRLVSRLELHRPPFGLDLTRRSLLGILKYPAPYSKVVQAKLPALPERLTELKGKDWEPPKCYLDSEQNVVDWILEPLSDDDRELFTSVTPPAGATGKGKTRYEALDTSIMDVADNIAYAVHDFEDGIALRLLHREEWMEAAEHLDPTWGRKYGLDPDDLSKKLFSPRTDWNRRKDGISAMVNAMVSSVQISHNPAFQSDIIAYNVYLPDEAERFRTALDDVKFRHVIDKQEVQTLEYRGRMVVMRLFEALQTDTRLLVANSQLWLNQGLPLRRVVCDYIAGMTDAYASRVYERLFVPRQGSIFERL